MKKIAGYILTGSIGVIAGAAFGFWGGKKYARGRINPCGILRIDHSEPNEQPKLFLEVTNVTQLENSDSVIFEIKRENYLKAKEK